MLNRPVPTRREALRACLAAFSLCGAKTALTPTSADFEDGFERRTDSWIPVTGQWFWRSGFVEQTELKKEIAILELSREVPSEYEVRARLKLVEGPTYRSAGILLGYQDPDNYAGVYATSVAFETENFGPKVQMFYREKGRDYYPPARVSFPVQNGTWYDLAVEVRKGALQVSVNNKQVLSHPLPTLLGKRVGLFAFDVRAEFDRFQLRS